MFDKQIKEFNENLLSLREFIALIKPVLVEERSNHHKLVSPVFELATIEMDLKNKPSPTDEELSTLNLKREKLKNELDDLYKGIKVDVKADSENDDSKIQILIPSHNKDAFLKNLKNTSKANSHITLLYRNALISLMSSVEWFFAQIMHYYYEKHPDASGIDSRTITFSELKSYTSLKDAEKYLIEEKIENVLRGSLESWIDFLKKDWKLGLSYVEPHLADLVEISQRRNLFVHNGGIVNSIYLAKVDSKLKDKAELNKPIDVNEKYLDQAISKLHLIFTLIAAEIWKKLNPEDELRAEILGDIAFENMIENRWEIAQGLSYFSMKDTKMPSAHRVVAELNNWLCRKRLGESSNISKEIKTLDFSDKKEIFQLALLALKEDSKAFFDLLPKVLDSKQLNTERLEEFPIFSEMRTTKEYLDFKNSSEYFKKASESIIDD